MASLHRLPLTVACLQSSLDLQLSHAESAAELRDTADNSSVVELATAVASDQDGLKALGDEVDNPWLVDVKTASGTGCKASLP